MQLNENKHNITKFLKIVDRYTEITELNYEILHEFIDKINVFEVDKTSKTRRIEMVYNFIGAFNPTAPVKNLSKSKRSILIITTVG